MQSEKQFIQFLNLQNEQSTQQIEQCQQQCEQEQQTTTQTTSFLIPSICQPKQYLSTCLLKKKIQILTQPCPIFPNIYLSDISLLYKGPMQDKAYSRNKFYYANVRRGNTICQKYQGEIKEYFWVKRGLKKFYDLEKDYLKQGLRLTTQHKLWKQRIFQGLDNASTDSQVHLYSIFKQNGQHCQITYVKQLNCWLFGSKNVSILVRDQSDIQKYGQKIRFYWSKMIAYQFLLQIKSLSQSEIQQLKQQLCNKTLLGQHCGSPQHQHITCYPNQQIIFYAIVQKVSDCHCLPVQYCKKFLKKYNFKMSKIKELTGLTTKNTINKNIYSLLKQTAEGSMEEYGEGSVLYIVEELKDGKQRMVGMCKLKTTEYLIFRRLREMLKLYVSRKSTANQFQKFKYDIQNLVQNYFKPPKNIQFYEQIAKQAFKQAANDSNVTETYLRYKFVDFMKKVDIKRVKQQNYVSKNILKKYVIICLPLLSRKLQKFSQQQNLPIQYMYRQSSTLTSSIHILHIIPRLINTQNLEIIICQYNQEQIKEIDLYIQKNKEQLVKRSHLVGFVKSQERIKSLMLLNNKIKGLEEDLSKKSIRFNIVKGNNIQEQVISIIKNSTNHNTEVQLKQQNQNNTLTSQLKNASLNKQPKLYIIYPLLLPGSGKSHLSKQLECLFLQKKISFSIISSDQIRRKLMDQNKQSKGQTLDIETQNISQTFTQVKQQTYLEFNKQIKDKIQLISNNQVKQSSFLFIDKVFGPEILIKELQNIKTYNNIVPVVLLPQSLNEFHIKKLSFPFSLQYLLICLQRCIQRSHHQTLTRRPQQICLIFLWFLSHYQNFNPKKLQSFILKSIPTTIFTWVQTIIQSQENTHSILKRKLEEALSQNKDRDKAVELIGEMYKNQNYLKDIYKEEGGEGASKLAKALIRLIQ